MIEISTSSALIWNTHSLLYPEQRALSIIDKPLDCHNIRSINISGTKKKILVRIAIIRQSDMRVNWWYKRYSNDLFVFKGKTAIYKMQFCCFFVFVFFIPCIIFVIYFQSSFFTVLRDNSFICRSFSFFCLLRLFSAGNWKGEWKKKSNWIYSIL